VNGVRRKCLLRPKSTQASDGAVSS
jgi:hypothetical protein